MFHFLAFMLLFFLVAVFVAIGMAVWALRRGIGIFRSAARRATGAGGRDASARGHAGPGPGSARRAQGATGVTVIDTRDRATASRRIFADDEGEYVDYKEVE